LCHVTLNLEENVSCKNLIWFETKLLRRQRLVSDARRNVRLYSTIKDRKSPLKGSRPSVPHGTNFSVFGNCCYYQNTSSAVFTHFLISLQCFDTVDCVTTRTSGLTSSPQRFFFGGQFGDPSEPGVMRGIPGIINISWLNKTKLVVVVVVI